jgi:hypothetical protein
MRDRASTLHRAAVSDALDSAREAQRTFWTSLSRLEDILGREFDGTVDFSQIDVDRLLRTKSRT